MRSQRRSFEGGLTYGGAYVKSRLNSRRRSLRGPELVEILLVLHQLQLHLQLLFRCPRRGRRDGGRVVLLRGELVDLCALLGKLSLQPLDGRLFREGRSWEGGRRVRVRVKVRASCLCSPWIVHGVVHNVVDGMWCLVGTQLLLRRQLLLEHGRALLLLDEGLGQLHTDEQAHAAAAAATHGLAIAHAASVAHGLHGLLDDDVGHRRRRGRRRHRGSRGSRRRGSAAAYAAACLRV